MKLIDKDALVAEIERRRDAALMRQQNLEAIGQETVLNKMIAFELNRIISLIDTLEVKEVDFEEELKHYCNDYYNCDYPKQIEEGSCSEVMPHIVSAAKHFFELGIKAQKREEG